MKNAVFGRINLIINNLKHPVGLALHRVGALLGFLIKTENKIGVPVMMNKKQKKDFNQWSDEIYNKIHPFLDVLFNCVLILMLCLNAVSFFYFPDFVTKSFIGVFIAFLGLYKVKKYKFNAYDKVDMFVFFTLIASSIVAALGVFLVSSDASILLSWSSRAMILLTLVFSTYTWFKSKRLILDKYDCIISILSFIQTLNIIG